MLHVRQTVVICASLVALLAPAAALAVQEGSGDGTLVVKDGSAPKGVAVVTLAIQGAVIGHVAGRGRLVIEDLTGTFVPEVTNYDWHKTSGLGEDTWVGTDFRFRAVGGTYKITIYGQDISLVASGQGSAVLTGLPDAPAADGRFSLNGSLFRSLPATPTRPLLIPTASTG